MSHSLETVNWATGPNEAVASSNLAQHFYTGESTQPQPGEEDIGMFMFELDVGTDMMVDSGTSPDAELSAGQFQQAGIQQTLPQTTLQPPWGSAPAGSHNFGQAYDVHHDLSPLRSQRYVFDNYGLGREAASTQQLIYGQHTQHALPPQQPSFRSGPGESPPVVSALRGSRGAPETDKSPVGTPPVWLSGDGTPCMSPPAVSQTWDLSSITNMPDAAATHIPSKWSSDAACSLLADRSVCLPSYESCIGQPTASDPHSVPHSMQSPLTQLQSSHHHSPAKVQFGSAPSIWNTSARLGSQASGSYSGFGVPVQESFERGIKPNHGSLRGQGIAVPQRRDKHLALPQHPQSAPPLATLRVSSRLQGRGKQIYCEYDRDAFSHSDSGSEADIDSRDEAVSQSPTHRASSCAKLYRDAGSSSDGEPNPSLSPDVGHSTHGSYSWARRRSKGSNAPLLASVGSGGFVSRSGRTVKPGRAYSLASPSERTTLSASLPRNLGATAHTSSLNIGIVKRKRIIHAPAALRDGLDVDSLGHRRKQHNPWTREETEALVKGVESCGGAGKWQDIKRLGLPQLQGRSAVDLKDKWRNLLRVAELPPALASARAERKREGPSSLILDRVRELALVTLAKAAASDTRIPSSRPRARGRLLGR